jgi:hypothetical protein
VDGDGVEKKHFNHIDKKQKTGMRDLYPNSSASPRLGGKKTNHPPSLEALSHRETLSYRRQFNKRG